MKLLHLSDLHIKSSNASNRDVQQMFDFIQNNYQEHVLVITGDITQDGDEDEYEHAARMLGPFRGRVYLCPGNHDFGKTGMAFDRARAERFDRFLSEGFAQNGTFAGDNKPVVNIRNDGDLSVLFVALDTNLETTSSADFSCGKVGDTQLESLIDILVDGTEKGMTRVLYFHHHPFMWYSPAMKLLDADSLMDAAAGGVDIMLFGHKHTSGIWTDYNGIPRVCASANSPKQSHAWEIRHLDGIPSVATVPIC